MKMNPVKSSQIESIGHDSATNTLIVKFKNGGTYHYDDVKDDKYQAMLKADSHGTFLSKHIKQKHSFRKIS